MTRTRSSLLALLALAVLVAGVLLGPPASAAEERSPQLRREGRWLVDPQGRVVIVHGLNLVWKHAPYAAPATREGFTRRDARWLARHGFNAARVGTLWAGLTPDAPGRADPAYLRRTQRVLDLLAKRRIWIQLDLHQDQWHETYGGEGAPDWAMIRPQPFAALPPVTAPFPTGYWTPEVSTVFDRFWADEDGLLDGWAAAWRVAARQWRRQPYLMGYDLLNEPWMGLEWPTCLVGGCPSSYERELQPAMERGLAAIRRVAGATSSGGSPSSSPAASRWTPSTPGPPAASATSASRGTATAPTSSWRARASPAATSRTARSSPPVARSTRSTSPAGWARCR
ncbi:cellulase family glycosylhydrolase [Nocardioides lianchengensis]|uniref:Endoglycosylceramidase n=1 Tax=Nocardioides lianchengensis TaxID=1045774 RepID=A0A1G6VF68_9ACTN|nr:cellulase family glycosylhydrolase [Nocardioides lianchengensis]NYG11243.1 endoglycosylceramidase [Nocardioides lianchengensis]SDD51657.1 endoglycosylceramidase [Nocardioides lianchengensis]